jgi:hypothetical protein
MLAVASASQKDSLSFFIWFSSFLVIRNLKMGSWFDNLGSYITKNGTIPALTPIELAVKKKNYFVLMATLVR